MCAWIEDTVNLPSLSLSVGFYYQSSEAGFRLCVCVCAHTHSLVCDRVCVFLFCFIL